MAKVKLTYQPTPKSRALSPGYRVGQQVEVSEEEAKRLTRSGAWKRDTGAKPKAAKSSGKGASSKGASGKGKTAPAAEVKEGTDG